MIYFNSDYTEGAHPKILQKLIDTNLEQTPGYGTDDYCWQAAAKIKQVCKREDVGVHFVMGGTQANLTLIAAALRPYQGVISAHSGHINVHETGAIEATGHKIISLPSADGKLTADQIHEVIEGYRLDENREHTVQPKLVYLSQPTENGTLYSASNLTKISRICRDGGLLLFIDGARLGYALAAPGNDLDLETIADLCDAFTIGGTKVGALFGEALVIGNPDTNRDFRSIIKQKGGMLAKGRLLGLQFLALFEDGLYSEIGRHAVDMALRIKTACQQKGYPFLVDSITNQQFPIMPDAVLDELGQTFAYSWWAKVDDTHSAVRFCTSWATREEDLQQLIEAILEG